MDQQTDTGTPQQAQTGNPTKRQAFAARAARLRAASAQIRAAVSAIAAQIGADADGEGDWNVEQLAPLAAPLIETRRRLDDAAASDESSANWYASHARTPFEEATDPRPAGADVNG